MLTFIKELAQEAGALALAGRRNFDRSQIHAKATELDLVTDTDRNVEALITAAIRRRFPEHGIFGEESGKFQADREYCWIIDPIDGTTSFIHDLPNWSVSIALARHGETVAGVVYAPVAGELYAAASGEGASCNGTRIQVSGCARPVESLLITGFGCLRAKWREENNLKYFARIAPEVAGLRRFGSAALDCCYVARGAAEAFWELNLQPYDIAAGALIVREAGGTVTDLFGGPDYPGKGFLADNGAIHGVMLDYFHDYRNLRR